MVATRPTTILRVILDRTTPILTHTFTTLRDYKLQLQAWLLLNRPRSWNEPTSSPNVRNGDPDAPTALDSRGDLRWSNWVGFWFKY